MAPVEFTPAYAAPETVRAHVDGDTDIAVDGAVDIWALGLIAFELLTKERAFSLHTPVEAIFAALLGKAPLPWEGPERDPAVAARLTKLQAFKTSVLQCLDRDQRVRPSVGAVIASWQHVFAAAETQATRDSTGGRAAGGHVMRHVP
jgi:serine/threonine protein kinase